SPEESWEQRTETTGWATGFSLRRNARSNSILGRYLIDPFRVKHSYSRGLGRTWFTRDTTTAASGEVSYNLSLGQMRLLRLPIIEYLRLRPTSVSWTVSRSNQWETRWDNSGGTPVQTRLSTSRRLFTSGSVGFGFWKGQSTSLGLSVSRDLLYPWEGDMPFNVGRETSRSQQAGVSQEINLFDYLKPRLSWDAAYSSSRLAPHTGGNDSLGLHDFSVSTTRKLTLRVGLVHAIRRLARLRDERLDEQAAPGSPRWLLMKLERFADRITDPTITISRTQGSDYRDADFLPGYTYRFGLETELDELTPYDRTKQDLFQVSTGVRPLSTLSVRGEYSNSVTRHYYSGYWNRQESTTWPSITVSWSGIERLPPFESTFRSINLSSGYRVDTSESGRYENEEYVPTSETRVTKWMPLLSVSATFQNEVRVSIADNRSVTETLNYTGTSARTRSSSHGTTLSVEYSFSAPGGIAIPLPLLSKLRVSFQSDLTTSLDITRSRTVSEVIGGISGDQVQSDREEWRIEPAANYDFGSVTAGLTGIYGWKTDRVNSIYNQRDVGMNIWILFNF
ncbi:hypothetical protein JW921_03620, partial [Candidatus Fermentibacterales bacterium]|nr:hypothetical protein [Candidatus Fermentibacterales bacterium]